MKRSSPFHPWLMAVILFSFSCGSNETKTEETTGDSTAPASTTPALALLKLKTDADIIPCFAFPLPDGRYRFRYCDPVQVDLTGDRKEDIFRITQACTKIIENEIRQQPQYWLWMHRRWKTQPSTKEIIPDTDPISAENSRVSAG